MKTLVRLSIETHERMTYACDFCGREFRNFRECECHEEFCESNKARAPALKVLEGKCYRVKLYNDDKFSEFYRIKKVVLKESWRQKDVAIVEQVKMNTWYDEKLSLERMSAKIIPLEELRANHLTKENEIDPEQFKSIIRNACEYFLTQLG